MNIPKKHHYIPNFLLNNFTDSNGLLWIFQKEPPKLYRSKPKNSFLETDFYTKTEMNGSKKTCAESNLSSHESKVARILHQLIGSIHKGAPVSLSPEDYAILCKFLYILFDRNPAIINKAVQITENQIRDSIGHEPFRSSEEMSRIKRNAPAHVVNCALKDPSDLEVFKNKELTILHIKKKNKSLLIGSFPIVTMETSYRPGNGIWLPIASDIAIKFLVPIGNG